MAVAAARLTAEEYLATTDGSPGMQLIDGEIVVTDPAFRHQRIVGEIYRLLANWLAAHPGHGETGMGGNFHLDDRNVFVPDVWWTPEERRPGRDAGRYAGPPALGVEVRSPSTWRYDVGTKMRTYEREGMSELWLVDTPADTVLVFRRSSPAEPCVPATQAGPGFDVSLELVGGEALTTPLLPGLELDLAALFDR